jgi:hypothetical protein
MKSLKINFGQILKLFICGITIPFLFGCSKELSREEAEKQIKQKFQFPQNEFVEFQNKEQAAIVAYLDWDYHTNFPEKYDKVEREYLKNQTFPKSQLFSTLESDGLITINNERVDINLHLGYTGATRYDYEEYYNAVFTDKAKPLVQGNSVQVATIEFGEITGIIERKEYKTAEVQYTTKRTNITAFGKAYNKIEEIFNHSTTFTKYDDGWRLQ